jgi:aspartyl-tRNA(Asn)/glutamyl-tRNA(Gln) amidotransferase subunit A
MESTAGSKILNSYKPLFDATSVQKIKKQGGIILGKTAQDAFGFGGFSVNVGIDKKIPLNPIDKLRACGGSSGGCAGATKNHNIKHISLAESTGGSIVCPASFCGVVGLCPTYGRVSRFGLMDYANSLDKIGPTAKTVKETALMLEVISGIDENDSTSANVEVQPFTEYVGKSVKGMKIGIIKEAFEEGINPDVKVAVEKKIKELKSQGVELEEVSLPLTSKYGLSVYYIIAMCEASTNLAKYCGMRYGQEQDPTGMSFNDYFTKIRTENLNEESKRRIIIGTFARMSGFRDAYYIKAAKIRTLIINEYKELFKKYDALICPTMPVVAPKFEDIKKMTPLENYMMDILTVGPNLAGLPHITLPSDLVDEMPTGTMLIADHFNEEVLVQLGSSIENKNNSGEDNDK